ncbi:MAG: NnrU family protein [Allopontixanthobacter sediminis]
MDAALVSLIAASAFFVGSHFAMSHPLRAPMVRVLGPTGFQGAYSLISIAAIVWMYFAFKAVDAPALPLWAGFDDVSWVAGSLFTLLGMVLLAGSFAGNPALPAPGAEDAARKEPAGVFLVTRHPMMWGFSLAAIGHLIAAPTSRTLVVMTSVIILALVGARMQDRKKETLMGDAWRQWESRTSYWPRWSRLLQVKPALWLAGLALWLLLTWLHTPAGGLPAGLWRWI